MAPKDQTFKQRPTAKTSQTRLMILGKDFIGSSSDVLSIRQVLASRAKILLRFEMIQVRLRNQSLVWKVDALTKPRCAKGSRIKTGMRDTSRVKESFVTSFVFSSSSTTVVL